MLERLGNALRKTTDRIANAIFLDKTLVDSVVKELQRALIEADVNVSLVKELSEKVKKEALDERLKGIEKKEHIIKILHDELIRILGTRRELVLGDKSIVMMVGLYGAGKTTTIGKLGAYYAKRGRKVCAVGLDVHRPAASDQLAQVCEKVGIACFVDKKEKDPLKIWKEYEKEIKKYNFVLVDSAGRDALDEELIDELKKIKKTVSPTETILVFPADIGQAAKKQAQAFKEAAHVTGVFISRMDSSAKGGGALTACAEVKAPVVFIGTGEKVQDIETFDPESFLSRLLGMGDLKTLMDKVHSVMGAKEIERQQRRLEEGKFTLRDFQEQLGSMGELGSFDKIMGMIPGLGKVKDKVSSEQLETQQGKLEKWKHAINSMTPEEIESPEILEKQTSRIQRVAHGSGTSTSDIRMMLKQYKLLKEMISSQGALAEGKMDQKTLMKFAKKFGRKMRF